MQSRLATRSRCDITSLLPEKPLPFRDAYEAFDPIAWEIYDTIIPAIRESVPPPSARNVPLPDHRGRGARIFSRAA